jgi:hypothetical protein
MITGRPPYWTPEKKKPVIELILKEISGGKGLYRMCKEYKDDSPVGRFPTRDTVYDWLREDKTFAYNYAESRRRQADFHSEDLLEICEEAIKAAQDFPNNSCLQQAYRNKLDSKKWIAGKQSPRVYGRTDLNITNDDKKDDLKLTEEELDAKIAELHAKQKEIKGES